MATNLDEKLNLTRNIGIMAHNDHIGAYLVLYGLDPQNRRSA